MLEHTWKYCTYGSRSSRWMFHPVPTARRYGLKTYSYHRFFMFYEAQGEMSYGLMLNVLFVRRVKMSWAPKNRIRLRNRENRVAFQSPLSSAARLPIVTFSSATLEEGVAFLPWFMCSLPPEQSMPHTVIVVLEVRDVSYTPPCGWYYVLGIGKIIVPNKKNPLLYTQSILGRMLRHVCTA